jgi:peptide-methionine (S)-S-oxide reductase
MATNEIQSAYLAGGCFWCTEAEFKMLKGVLNVTPGYAGGEGDGPPNYDEVSTGKSGYAETIKVDFDPDLITYGELLDIFWHVHDPTTPNQQGNDMGTQYRSIIFFADESQEQIALQKLEVLTKSGEYKGKIVTEIIPLDKFYRAEDYHKDYFEKNPQAAYCQLVISPKLEHLKERYSTKLKV